uniref:Uncharacterized protein n=1 Tax=Arundo donax TaxID=35708 RepID=A0A0A9A738_ARUDO
MQKQARLAMLSTFSSIKYIA